LTRWATSKIAVGSAKTIVRILLHTPFLELTTFFLLLVFEDDWNFGTICYSVIDGEQYAQIFKQ
jgi:hypothetical protein